MLTTRDILGVEILSVGSWHGTGCPPAGCDFTTDDLDEIAATYTATSTLFSPPVKLGHDDNQALLQSDGFPAAGWLSNVRRVGNNLVADLMKVPGMIADLIDVGAYRTRSVELEGNYEIGGKKYGIALTGMALLGADVPAVDGLKDMVALYAKQNLTLPDNARAVIFTAQRKTHMAYVGAHEPIDGSHTHAHSAYGSSGGDATHTHQHSHANDAGHMPGDSHMHTNMARTFALPAGISYDDLTSRLVDAFCDQNPGAQPDDCWIADVFDDRAIFCLSGDYWQQIYAVGADGTVTMTGMPSEVQRVTDWQSVDAKRANLTYADHAEHVLADVQAFTARAGELAALRAKGGRTLSAKHRQHLTELRDGLDGMLRISSDGTKTPENHGYKRQIEAALLSAELSMAALQGVR